VDGAYEAYHKLLRGHDYYIFQEWATPISDAFRASFKRVLGILGQWQPEQLHRHILEGIAPLFALKIHACQEPIPDEEIGRLFADEMNLAHTWVYSSRLQLTAENKGRRKEYLVTPGDTMALD